ncbi:PREDICTED: uncharacterized protein LOC106814495 [Priapulus caudatus]|uniref:Uncharacterized protein LOC106814495 n=1 Tax=Priapulus caudatus TaxID=37621 RepID=A0ABM1EQ22_PRICU|nr:PREDICTED: uncharacterized protein LOC106814495 [Priapulus caudatus]
MLSSISYEPLTQERTGFTNAASVLDQLCDTLSLCAMCDSLRTLSCVLQVVGGASSRVLGGVLTVSSKAIQTRPERQSFSEQSELMHPGYHHWLGVPTPTATITHQPDTPTQVAAQVSPQRAPQGQAAMKQGGRRVSMLSTLNEREQAQDENTMPQIRNERTPPGGGGGVGSAAAASLSPHNFTLPPIERNGDVSASDKPHRGEQEMERMP